MESYFSLNVTSCFEFNCLNSILSIAGDQFRTYTVRVFLAFKSSSYSSFSYTACLELYSASFWVGRSQVYLVHMVLKFHTERHFGCDFDNCSREGEMKRPFRSSEGLKNCSLEFISDIGGGLNPPACWLMGSHGATFALATRLWLPGKHRQMDPALVICSSDGWQRYSWSPSHPADPMKMTWHGEESIRFGWQITTWHQLRLLQKGYAANNRLLRNFVFMKQ